MRDAVLLGSRPKRCLAVLALLFCGCGGGGDVLDAPPPPRLLASATQDGPVAFRDPLGAVSPNGQWLAYTEHRRVRVQPVEGGALRTYGSGERQPRALAWLPESDGFIVEERTYDRSSSVWMRYDLRTGASTPYLEGLQVQAQPLPDDTLARFLDPLNLTRHSPGPTPTQGLAVERDMPNRVWFWRQDSVYNGADRGDLGGPVLGLGRSSQGGVSCLVAGEDSTRVLRLDCFGRGRDGFQDVEDVYGRFVWAPDGEAVYFSRPNDRGVLELWARAPRGGTPRLLASFARDAYSPSVDQYGRVVFKTQDYRTFIAWAPAEGGESVPLTTFQSETPTWSPDGSQIAVTYGSWRRAVDDAHYPDIAQNLGILDVGDGQGPLSEPSRVFRSSNSEDQGLHWSPNGRWVAFHTHADGTDDVFVQAADGSGEPIPVSLDGSETGWPRWSRDGTSIVFPSYHREPSGARRSALYVVGVDEVSGAVVEQSRRVSLSGFSGDALQAEWLDDGKELVFEAAERFGEKALYRVSSAGGTPQRIHTFATDQLHSGISASPDGAWVAFVAPDADGFYQIFRIPSQGGAPQQLTFDATHKTQPAYDPRGERIAFTVFHYQAHFWMIEP